MDIQKNIIIESKHEKPILIDTYYTPNSIKKQVVLFCHGYKGYKDWGAWELVAKQFADQNIFFVKMNFSHNGGTVNQPIDFPDLQAFGNNNFIKELDDIDAVLDWLFNNNSLKEEMNLTNVSLIGHSRGGGIVLIKANEDNRITKVVTWAGVSDFATRFPSGKELKLWEENGVAYILNGRTKQQMPHYFQFYTNFKENEERLNIKKTVQELQIPYLIIHGVHDETVSIKEAENLHKWNKHSALIKIKNGNHNFGSMHPWHSSSLPQDLQLAGEKTIQFLQ